MIQRLLSRRLSRISFFSILLLVILILANSPISVRSASAITVTNTNDSGAGSLRQAIADVPSGGTINFAVTGTINTVNELTIDKSLTIQGPGSGLLDIDCDGNKPVFFIRPSGHIITISGLTISNGSVGIYNHESLVTIDECVITENGNYNYGGISNYEGSLTITNTQFIDNDNPGHRGGAINNQLADLTIENCLFSGNTAQTLGGAIAHHDGTLDIDGSTFMNNSTDTSNGGAIWIEDGTVIINDTTFTDNTASTKGGAVYVWKTGTTLTITNNTFDNNSAGEDGGAIYTDDAVVNILNSTLLNNSADIDGGAIFAFEDLTIEDSTINNNTAGQHGGAILITKPMVATNSTISGNTADVNGGGIFISPPGLVTLNHVTLTGNTADGDSNGTGDGGGVYVQYSQSEVQFRNSIVAGNIDTSDTSTDDCYATSGVVTSLDYNLTGISTGCSLGGTHDQTTTDSKLLALADNGGDTETHALDTGSPALDQIPDGINGCGGTYITDQRGIPRPWGTHCDIGAYEFSADSFIDVTLSHWAYDFIEAIANAGLTSGYPDGTFRPENRVTRAEMAVFLLNGMGVTAPAMDGSHPFTDIAGHWAVSFIEELYDQGITGGYPDGTYRPENLVTRAEMAVFLLKGIGVTPPAIDGSHPFTDVAGHWAENFIEELFDQGITGGYPDGTYRPDNRVTRAEMAVFLVNTFGIPLP